MSFYTTVMDEARWERIERTIEFLTNQQANSEAKFSAWSERAQEKIEELLHVQSGHQVLIDALFAQDEKVQRTLDRVSISLEKLNEAQLHTEERLNALIGFVDRKLGGSPIN